MTDHLRRKLAPISSDTWRAIDEEVSRTLRNFLAARRLVEFSGPHGWEYTVVDLGRTRDVRSPNGDADGVSISLPQLQPLAEMSSDFALLLTELDAIERGAQQVDLAPAVGAARALALEEDRAVFHSLGEAGIQGIAAASACKPVTLDEDFREYPRGFAEAVGELRDGGVDGPYGAALGTRCYTGVIETSKGGSPVLEHLELILGGPIVWAPAVDGAVVVSQRGGDYELVVGEDFSIGFRSANSQSVVFRLEESFTFRVNTPEAGIALTHGAA
jgi:uncharacterized linocin/CFP29 family protein